MNQEKERKRCAWSGNDHLYIAYHDEEWGVPVHDDSKLFEMLVLDGAQAGLSWLTILRKREHYRRAFDNFDPHKVANYDADRVNQLRQDPGIVRNRLKIESAVKNAQAVLRVQEQFGSLDALLWQFVDFKPRQNAWKFLAEIPTHTLESDTMSKELKRLGFSFVGSTICYAFMQAAGMVNDHLVDCFRYSDLNSWK